MINPFAVAVGLVISLTIGVALLLLGDRPERDRAIRVPTAALIALVLVVAVGAFVAQGMDSRLVRDEAVFVVTNIEVANGHLPYTAAFDNTGPLGPWFGGVGVAVGRSMGFDAVSSARMAYFPVALLAVVATFFLGLQMRLSAVASAVGALSLVALTTFSRDALSGPRPKLLVMVLVALFLVDLARGRYARSGVWVALATLTWQSSFLLALVALVAIPRQRPTEGTLRSFGKFAGGGLIPAAIVFGIYALQEEVETLIEGFITWNLRIASGRVSSTLYEAIMEPLKDLWGAHQATWPFLVLGALAVLPFTRRILGGRPNDQSDHKDDALDLVTIGFVAFVGWTLIDYQGVVDFFPLLPFTAVGVARVADHVRVRSSHWAVALLSALVIAGGIDLVRTRNVELPEQRADLLALAGSGCVASYGAPVALALTGQSNPHRFFFGVSGLDEHLGSEAVDYVKVLVASEPVFVGGPISPRDENLGTAVRQVLPAAGYLAVSSTWFEGWVRPDAADSVAASNCAIAP